MGAVRAVAAASCLSTTRVRRSWGRFRYSICCPGVPRNHTHHRGQRREHSWILLLDCWVAASRAGNSRSASGLTGPEVEVLLGKQPASQHETRAGSQQVLGEHLLGEVASVYPDTGLKAWIQRGILRAEPRLPMGCISHPASPFIATRTST